MAKIPFNKPPLSYSDQLSLLKSRGLMVENEKKALHILEHVSYYRMSGYWYPLLESPKAEHKFKANSSFETAFSIYRFDSELRHMIIRELEKIEVAVRAKMSYVLSHAYDPFWFTDNGNFKNNDKHTNSLEKLKDEFERSEEEFIKVFKEKYSDLLPPCWTMLEISSFGNLSTLYSNLNSGLNKRKISHYFGLDDKTFTSWLHTFTYVRNVCAHHSRLWNKSLAVSPRHPKNPRSHLKNG